jgi:hypothetical protein
MTVSEIDKLHKPYENYEETARGDGFSRPDAIGVESSLQQAQQQHPQHTQPQHTQRQQQQHPQQQQQQQHAQQQAAGACRAGAECQRYRGAYADLDDDYDDPFDDDTADRDEWQLASIDAHFAALRAKRDAALAARKHSDKDAAAANDATTPADATTTTTEPDDIDDEEIDDDEHDEQAIRPAYWSPTRLDAALASDAWRRAPLRVGVVSADISDSNVGQSLIGWLSQPDLDNGRVELFIYALVDDDGTGWRKALCGGGDGIDRCRNVGALDIDKLKSQVMLLLLLLLL